VEDVPASAVEHGVINLFRHAPCRVGSHMDDDGFSHAGSARRE
jgi:hypothetical protein